MGVDCDKYTFFSPQLRSTKAEMVSCRNHGRYFLLEKRGQEASYAIKALGEDPATRSTFDAVLGKYLHAAWATLNQDVTYWMASSQFHFVSERVFKESGRDLVEVVFQHGDSPKDLASFKVTFDPALHWAIVRSDSSLNGRMMEQFRINYDHFASGRLFMRSVQLVDISGRELVCEFDPVKFVHISEDEFTLEHYGLKDPIRKSQPPSSPLIIFGLLLLGVCLLIAGRWLYRRSIQIT